MGYIPSSSTQNLYAYLTQTGRYNLLFKDAMDFQVKYFTLHDNDVNYEIASQIINSNFNKLPKGFVPDITGDNDDCIRSIAQATDVDPNSIILPGGNASQYIRPVYVGFTETKNSPTSINPTLLTITGQFTLTLTPPRNDNTPITTEEKTNTSYVIYVVSNTIGVKNIKINGSLNESTVNTFDETLAKTFTFSFDKDTSINTSTSDLTIDANVVFGIKDLKYATERGGSQSYTYSATLTIKGKTNNGANL
jgi:hypothetical protein